MKRVLVLLIGAACLVSCRSTLTPSRAARPDVRLYVETTELGGALVALPESGVQLRLASPAVAFADEILSVQVVQAELGRALVVEVSDRVARELSRLAASPGRPRIVLFAQDHALAARRLDGPVVDRRVAFFAEVPDAELPALAANLNDGLAAEPRGAGSDSLSHR